VGISNRTTIYLIGIYAVETRKKKEVWCHVFLFSELSTIQFLQ
jgi:gamma-glutamylcyclotransferase (GGCT)/AIG2-like uncharacterized protein YtfP